MHNKPKLLLLLPLLLLFETAHAQNVFESLNDTAVVKAEETPSTAAPIMAKKWNHIESKYFTMNIAGEPYELKKNEAIDFAKVFQVDAFNQQFKKALQELKDKEAANGDYEKVWQLQK